MGVERRRNERYDILAQIRVKRGRVNYIMDVKNLSLSGAFVSSDSIKQFPWFRIGQELEMDLFGAEDLDNIRVEGQIVRVVDSGPSAEQGFGVEFTSLIDDAYGKIKTILNNRGSLLPGPPPLPQAGS